MWPRWAKPIWLLIAMFFFTSASLNLLGQSTNAGLGPQRFMEYCAGCHGVDGRGGDKAPPLVSSSNATNLSDAERIRIVREGTRAGMPPFAQIGETNIKAVIQYLHQLEDSGASKKSFSQIAVAGDAKAGRALYFGKAQCAQCHLMRGEGGFIARSLTAYGQNRSPEEILHAITSPDTPLVPSSRVVTVTTATGKKLTGILRNEDSFNLALQTEDGRYYLLSRSQVSNVRYTDHSLMPRDYSSRLSPKELEDIVSFLILESRNPAPEKAENR